MHDTQSPARPGPTRRARYWITLIAAAAIAAVAIFDWTRAPREQFSVRAYDFAVIGGYRATVRPITSHFTRCRFRPTCSRYSEEAMHAHGFPRGLLLTAWRLIRCEPWVRPNTYDPVPR